MLGGMKERNVIHNVRSLFCNPDKTMIFLTKKTEKIEIVTRPGGDGIHNSVYGHEKILALDHLFVPQATEGNFQ